MIPVEFSIRSRSWRESRDILCDGIPSLVKVLLQERYEKIPLAYAQPELFKRGA